MWKNSPQQPANRWEICLQSVPIAPPTGFCFHKTHSAAQPNNLIMLPLASTPPNSSRPHRHRQIHTRWKNRWVTCHPTDLLQAPDHTTQDTLCALYLQISVPARVWALPPTLIELHCSGAVPSLRAPGERPACRLSPPTHWILFHQEPLHHQTPLWWWFKRKWPPIRLTFLGSVALLGYV